MKLQEFYTSIGEDSSNPLRRFGSEQLLHKYLNKLRSDPTFADLCQAMERGEREQAFRAAHTLKGIALNLGLAPLVQVSNQLTELLRGADQIPQQAAPLFRELSDVYNCVVDKLSQLEE